MSHPVLHKARQRSVSAADDMGPVSGGDATSPTQVPSRVKHDVEQNSTLHHFLLAGKMNLHRSDEHKYQCSPSCSNDRIHHTTPLQLFTKSISYSYTIIAAARRTPLTATLQEQPFNFYNGLRTPPSRARCGSGHLCRG